MTELDVNSPKGQITVADERRAIELFLDEHPDYQFFHTDKRSKAHADGALVRYGELESLVLTSCRYRCSLQTFYQTWDSEAILTWRKLAIGALVCRRLQMHLVVFLYVVNDDALVVQHVFNPAHPRGQRWMTPIRLAYTQTQQNVNGGQIVRRNAYIKMDKGKVLRRRA